MAQASLIKWLFFSGAQDETGNPVANGSAYFYVPHNTSSQITVYADDAAATPLSQPVTLDSGGRATVFITESCEIKILDAAGASKRLVNNAENIAPHLVYCVYASSPTFLDTALATIEAQLSALAASAPVDASNVVTVSTASPSFAFDSTKQLNVFRATYGGDIGTLTITWAGTATPYARYRVVIQTDTTTSATGTAFPASFFTVSPPTTLAAHTFYAAEFQASDEFHMAQVTPWTVVNNLAW